MTFIVICYAWDENALSGKMDHLTWDNTNECKMLFSRKIQLKSNWRNHQTSLSWLIMDERPMYKLELIVLPRLHTYLHSTYIWLTQNWPNNPIMIAPRLTLWASCSPSWRALVTSPSRPRSSWSSPSPSRGGRQSASPSPTRCSSMFCFHYEDQITFI